jgi:hypothetical protein
VEKPVRSMGVVAKVAAATRSFRGLARRNACAAAIASRKGLPFIDCERSTASTTLLARPRFSASRALTGRPFSSSLGGCEVGEGVTTLARIVGYVLESTPFSSTPALAEPAKRKARASAGPMRKLRLMRSSGSSVP